MVNATKVVVAVGCVAVIAMWWCLTLGSSFVPTFFFLLLHDVAAGVVLTVSGGVAVVLVDGVVFAAVVIDGNVSV